ncbi:MAG: hypothetical protein LBJ08_06790 [Bifidobacteriaceae bacterium]|nr:hypothetical protein [Bifidobacteriaceae bacterium]
MGSVRRFGLCFVFGVVLATVVLIGGLGLGFGRVAAEDGTGPHFACSDVEYGVGRTPGVAPGSVVAPGAVLHGLKRGQAGGGLVIEDVAWFVDSEPLDAEGASGHIARSAFLPAVTVGVEDLGRRFSQVVVVVQLFPDGTRCPAQILSSPSVTVKANSSIRASANSPSKLDPSVTVRVSAKGVAAPEGQIILRWGSKHTTVTLTAASRGKVTVMTPGLRSGKNVTLRFVDSTGKMRNTGKIRVTAK